MIKFKVADFLFDKSEFVTSPPIGTFQGISGSDSEVASSFAHL